MHHSLRFNSRDWRLVGLLTATTLFMLAIAACTSSEAGPGEIETLVGRRAIAPGINASTEFGVQGDRVTLGRPTGITVDANGNIFIADREMSRVLRYDADSRIVTSVAGTGERGAGPTTLPAAEMALNLPAAVLVTPDGLLAVADSGNHRVLLFDMQSWTVVSSFGWRSPTSLYLGPGNTVNERRIYVGGSGGPVGYLDPVTGEPVSIAGFNSEGVAVDARFVYAAGGRAAPRLVAINIESGQSTELYGLPQFDPFARHSVEEPIIGPHAVEVLKNGSLIVADNSEAAHRLVSIDPTGQNGPWFIGDGSNGFSGDGGSVCGASFSSPGDLFLAPDGSLYIADTGNGRVRRVLPPLPESC